MQISTPFFRSASLAVLLTVGILGLAQGQTTPPVWSWARAAASPAVTFLSGTAADAAGNTYTAGVFQSTLTLAPGTVLVSQRDEDSYVAKYNAAGSLLWARQLAGTSNERIGGIVADAAGNVYLAGTFGGALQLGTLSLTSSGSGGSYIASIDAQGQPRWLREVSGNGALVHSIGMDATGNLYLSGFFSDLATVGGITLTARNTLSNFVAKLDPAGTALWAQAGGSIPLTVSTNGVYSNALTVSPAGDAYLSWTMHSAAGGFGAGPAPAGYGNNDVLLVRYNPQGVVQWQKRFGSAGDDYAGVTALDGNGHLLVPTTFSTAGPATVEGQTLTGTGQVYGALLQLDTATGTLQWVTKLEASSFVAFRAVVADAAGNSYLAGSFAGTAQAGSQQLSSNGSNLDVLVASYSAQGTPRWFQKSDGAPEEWAGLIALGGTNELSVGGSFTQQGRFGSSILTGGAATGSNGFVAHFSALPTATQAARVLALDIFPSPTTDKVHVPSLPAGTRVQLLDALGRVARETTVPAAAEVSVRGLAPGLYTLLATDAQGRRYAAHVAVE
ncbi:T9SS type A sorting domain-containing protein [Hymenobacter rubidus]|uniref:T9SS type A sorting domain-containing protein n=1 Tax=Hymenobacter rubidus TaxID=1441626 RepID=UPI00191CA738|nr:T9SS type A sorting domain-containing protein [Hymenobacter rubidus]